LNGAALAALDAAGLVRLPLEHGARPLTRMLLAAHGRSAELALGHGVVLSRQVFDAALVRQAIAAGAAFLPHTTAALGELSSETRVFSLESKGAMVECTARIVISADGLGGRLLARGHAGRSAPAEGSRVGAGVVVDFAPAFYRSGIIHMACGSGGYVGLVRLEDGRLDVAAALDLQEIRRTHGPGPVVVRILKGAGWPVPDGLETASWKGTLPLTWQTKQLAAGRVFAVGDAAGYLEPFTGEGIARALTGGLAVAPIAARAVHRSAEPLERAWTTSYRRLLGSRQFVCRTAALVLRYPRVVHTLISVLSYAPGLAAPVVRYLDAPFRATFTSGPL
jgi:flavin-dependent dehydrogenase